MPLITGCHRGAKAILWHYHYFCKAQKPFLLDWGSEDNQDLDIFGHVEKEHMRPIVTMVSRQGLFSSLISGERESDNVN
jgi:hypothetical protein